MFSKQIYSLKTMAKINPWIALNYEYTVIAKRGLIMSIGYKKYKYF